ncbi:MAG: 2-C-methyl-D-erythritol 4-phosphate cytidylyltransferase [Planctomycetes bacterium]|nr:2-C-methyl-D-erythritol 4-phosphate cytidylyltransferase [Planctomycetota bacterium]
MNPNSKPRAALVLVAAGNATRMGPNTVKKPFLPLGGRTMVEVSAAAFAALEEIVELVIVAHPDDLGAMRALAASSPALVKTRAVVPGGAERSDSVRLGAHAVSRDVEIVCVHDAARPLVESAVIARAIEVAAREGVALVALPVRDTIKVSSTGTHAEHTLDRSVLWAAQTPQVFRAELLRELCDRAHADGFKPTDDAALYEQYSGPVPLVEGDPQNLKVTTPTDLVIAEAILAARSRKEAAR